MASTTPNIRLTLPTGAEKVSRQIINDNNTKIDTAIGTLNSNLGSPSSASSVTGADAFSKINTLNSNIGIEQVGSTSIKTLTSNVPSSAVRRYFASSSSNLSDYPSIMSNYPNYIILTIKKEGAIGYIDIEAVAQNGTPGFVKGYYANNSLFWGSVL